MFVEDCPSGSVWDGSRRECVTDCGADGWADPTRPGECLSQDKCLARNADLGANAGIPRPSLTTCRDAGGCEFAMRQGEYETSTGNYGPNGEETSIYRGVMEYSGNPGSACGMPPEIDPDWNESEITDPEGQKCQGVSGQTLCVNQHGEHCYEASSNRFICWRPRETGEKSDEDYKQKRDAGDNPIPPNMQLPNGDQLQPKGNPIEVTYRDAQGNEIKTVTHNYQTINGTSPSGGKNDGQNKDGTGKDDGDGEDKGKVSGGGDCKSPPTVSGGDPLTGELVRQQWYVRCGNPNADPSDLDPGHYLGEGEPSADGLIVEGEEIGADGLNIAGFGWSSSCPQIPNVTINGRTITFDTSVFCNWLHLGGQLVLIMAALLSLRILSGGGAS